MNTAIASFFAVLAALCMLAFSAGLYAAMVGLLDHCNGVNLLARAALLIVCGCVSAVVATFYGERA